MMISDAEWAQFNADLAVFNQEVAQQPVVWKHISAALPRYGEDGNPTYETRSLLCVVSYNAFRVWPISDETEAGTIDKEYCYLLINNTYLSDNDWLTDNHNLSYNPNGDIFIVNGIEHEPSGNTPISQDRTKPTYTILILKRKTTPTPTVNNP